MRKLKFQRKEKQSHQRPAAAIQQLESRTLLAGNLLVNGNFTRGPTGFSTGYIYNRISIETEGTGVVGTNPIKYHPVGLSFGDHTTGAGDMLLINGAVRPDVTIWRETVSVIPGVAYSFTAWCASWGGVNDKDISPAVPQVSVDGKAIASINIPATDGAWTPLSGNWLARSNTATITLTDLNTNAAGNDSAYDDFSFSPLASIHGAVLSNTPIGQTKHVQKPLAGVIVYLDMNNDGILDAGDPTTLTTKSGTYAFTGLVPGTYQVCDVLPASDALVTSALSVSLTAGKQANKENLLDTPSIPDAVPSAVR